MTSIDPIDLSKTLTTDMTPAQYQQWRFHWIASWADSLCIECGMTNEAAAERASLDFEEFIGQAGDEARDEHILLARSLQFSAVHAP